MKKITSALFFIMLNIHMLSAGPEAGDTLRDFSIGEFIEAAVRNDTVFEEILIDELLLKYKKDLKLPAEDLIVELKGQYEFILSQSRSAPHAAVSLSKLFPYKGTAVSMDYKSVPALGSDDNSSELAFLISQPIARNAFGKETRIASEIVGIENELIRYQIIEAYEDYLSYIIIAYYNWYSAYKNLEIGKVSYEQSLKLLENINKRQKNRIALPIDVNKIDIQVLTKKEKLIVLQEKADAVYNIIRLAVRHNGDNVLVPVNPFMYNKIRISFDDDYEKFRENSRTAAMLDYLKKKAGLELDKASYKLLPSAKLLLGCTLKGAGFSMENYDSLIFTGVSAVWPFPGQKENAEHETSRISLKKTIVAYDNKHSRLYTDLKNLFLQIRKEEQLIRIAEEKIALAGSIMEDETKNYTYGKVSLNDFIDAVNRMDENEFNKIVHSVRLKILETEWLRLTDRLVSGKEIKTYRNKK